MSGIQALERPNHFRTQVRNVFLHSRAGMTSDELFFSMLRDEAFLVFSTVSQEPLPLFDIQRFFFKGRRENQAHTGKQITGIRQPGIANADPA